MTNKIEKLNLYLNESQYEKLCILAEECGEEVEEYANERFYDLLLAKWLKYKSDGIEDLFNNPSVDWEE